MGEAVSSRKNLGNIDTDMDRSEKLRLGADEKWCHCFRRGVFARLYERCLHWLSLTVNPFTHINPAGYVVS
jgi:hypothetical protein